LTRSPCTALAVVVAAGLVGAVISPAWAQTPPTANVSVDATAAGTPLERVWPFHGYDEINYTTIAEGRALLAQLAMTHTAPVHVRSHFLFNTGDGVAALKWGSTNIYTEDAGGNPVYSWTLIDEIMDAITGAGAFPLAEIGFMPQAMSSAPPGVAYRNTGTYTLDGGCFYPPNDYTKWATLIRTWAMHVGERYPDAGTTWQWELWNEPDLASGYWHATVADYNKLYDYTEQALHQALPTASLGGPAVASPGTTFLRQFLQHCATGSNAATGAIGARLDMISFHAKGGVAITDNHVEMDLGNQLRLHRSGFTTIAGFPAFRQTPIVITEADPDGCAACPASQMPADVYRNSPAYGAYEVAMMKRTLELEARLGVNLRGVLTWAFLFPGSPYFVGYRALESNGIDLPVLSAFKLLGRLDGTRLPVTSSGARELDDILANGVRGQADVDAMATLNGSEVQVLIWNYHDDIVTVAASPVHVSVKVPGAFGPRVVATHLRADDTHGDAYTLWVGQGSPPAPTAMQLEALRASMEPTLLEAPRVLDVADGAVTLDFDLPRFGISLITLAPLATVGDASAGDSGTALGGGTGSGGCGCAVAVPCGAGTETLLSVAMVAVLVLARRRC